MRFQSKANALYDRRNEKNGDEEEKLVNNYEKLEEFAGISPILT